MRRVPFLAVLLWALPALGQTTTTTVNILWSQTPPGSPTQFNWGNDSHWTCDSTNTTTTMFYGSGTNQDYCTARGVTQGNTAVANDPNQASYGYTKTAQISNVTCPAKVVCGPAGCFPQSLSYTICTIAITKRPVSNVPTVVDGVSNQAVNAATVSVRACDSCSVSTVVTPTYFNKPGSFAFLDSNGLPVGVPVPAGNEAMRIDVSQPSYLARRLFHRAQPGVNYTGRPIAVYAGSSLDSDGDGLPDVQENAIGTNRLSADTDSDGLPDSWEVNGYNYVDYPGLGAKPLHKGIFVECDSMQGQRPQTAAIQDAVMAFTNAPVSNPDGTTGVDLFVDMSQDVARDDILYPVRTEFVNIKNQNFPARRAQGFRYCVFGVNYNNDNGTFTSSSGISWGGTGDFLVSLGSFTGGVGSRLEQGGTFMHELGHTLGLGHGGADGVNYKPNYLSVMNYSFQVVGLRVNGVSGRLDYSRFNLVPLTEGSLNEASGLDVVGGTDATIAGYGTIARTSGVPRTINDATVNVDWNWNSVIDASNVTADINNDGALTTLSSQNDWLHLDFTAGGTIGPGTGSSPLTTPPVPCAGPAELY